MNVTLNALLITVTRFIINQFITTPCTQSLLALARRGINPYHSCTVTFSVLFLYEK